MKSIYSFSTIQIHRYIAAILYILMYIYTEKSIEEKHLFE